MCLPSHLTSAGSTPLNVIVKDEIYELTNLPQFQFRKFLALSAVLCPLPAEQPLNSPLNHA